MIKLSKDELDLLKEHFKRYLKDKDIKDARIKEHSSWAFTHYRNNIGIDFWESLRDEKTLQICYEKYLEVALNGGFKKGGVKDPKGYATSYMNSVRLLKDFLDYRYNGVDNFLKQL